MIFFIDWEGLTIWQIFIKVNVSLLVIRLRQNLQKYDKGEMEYASIGSNINPWQRYQ